MSLSPITLDDADPRISYSPGWQHINPSNGEFDTTRSSADKAGLTASLTFTGTNVQVYGSVASIDVFGRPVSTYAIDGGPTTTYQAPIVEPGLVVYRVQFYQSPTLSPGQHTLVITNINGTSPSNYVLDYIIYTPSNDVAQPPPVVSNNGTVSVPSSSPVTPPTSASFSSSTPASLPGSSNGASSPSASSISTPGATQLSPSVTALTQETAVQTGSSSASLPNAPLATNAPSEVGSRLSPRAAIIGGVVGGAVILLAIIYALIRLYQWRARRRGAQEENRTPLFPPEVENVTPFNSWPNTPAAATATGMHPSQKELNSASGFGYGPRSGTPVSTGFSSSLQSPGAGPSGTAPQMSQMDSTPAVVSGVVMVDRKLPPPPQRNLSSTTDSSSGVAHAGGSLDGSPSGSNDQLVHGPSAVDSENGYPGPHIRVHSDSGIRLPGLGGSPVVDIPPAYTAD
ncbi:hypothetical protein BDW22DRAFT_355691 [Trametopsis cervina]|nr:hypothetical protein BDW22DRAFT_355691 [Trametopsis cervina]